jgi:hypothetical protein
LDVNYPTASTADAASPPQARREHLVTLVSSLVMQLLYHGKPEVSYSVGTGICSREEGESAAELLTGSSVLLETIASWPVVRLQQLLLLESNIGI